MTLPCWPAALLALLACGQVQAAGGLAPGEPGSIESCAGGPALAVAIGDSRALLDDIDRQGVVAAMLARYPVLGQNGFAPQQMLLWQKAPNDWLYVALAAKAGQPGVWCSMASFSAARFEFSTSMVQKYFFAKPAPT
jgi:hypothetical protein